MNTIALNCKKNRENTYTLLSENFIKAMKDNSIRLGTYSSDIMRGNTGAPLPRGNYSLNKSSVLYFDEKRCVDTDHITRVMREAGDRVTWTLKPEGLQITSEQSSIKTSVMLNWVDFQRFEIVDIYHVEMVCKQSPAADPAPEAQNVTGEFNALSEAQKIRDAYSLAEIIDRVKTVERESRLDYIGEGYKVEIEGTWTWIYFDEKPDAATLVPLSKSKAWHFSGGRSAWYCKEVVSAEAVKAMLEGERPIEHVTIAEKHPDEDAAVTFIKGQ